MTTAPLSTPRRTAGVVTALLLVLVLGLSGCGDGSEDRAEDPARAADSSDTGDTDTDDTDTGDTDSDDGSGSGSADPPRVIEIVSGTAAGGEVDPTPTVLDSPAAVADYVGAFTREPLGSEIAGIVRTRTTAPDRVLAAAVIAIGCDVPPSATVVEEGEGYTVVPGKIPSPHQECYAPVTSVAIVELPAEG